MNRNPFDQSFSPDPRTALTPGTSDTLASGLTHPLADLNYTSGSQTPSQKRQNSMSAYANNPSNKRTPNQLQMQLPLQSNVIGAPNYQNPTAARAGQSTSRRSVRKTTHLPSPSQAKTPTASSFDVPLSPGVNPASLQNNSDSTGSSPAVDQQTAVSQQSQSSAFAPQDSSQATTPMPATAQRVMSDEEQQLATKLKETYKNIVNFEEVVQKSCIDLTMKISQTNVSSEYQSSMYGSSLPGSAMHSNVPLNSTELSNDLWTIYHHNVTLLNNYYDFLITALKPTANTTQFKTGRNIVDLYKIPRRMWVYGIVGLLEVLKNIMSIFQDHEIFSCFIAYCFNVVSNLTDPALEMEGWWCEKLGDLSRMAIALYSSRFIDWKISAEYWYSVALKTMYGHGKIYYHMCTVQQDNLDALVNIGKSVMCRDPFVPTQQYLRMVVENICTQRNILSLLELPIIDFIKIHKVLLSIHSSQNKNVNPDSSSVEQIHDSQLQYGVDLVTRYGLTFGCDSQGYNFFTRSFCIPEAHQNKYGSDIFNSYLKQQHEQDQQANTLDTMEKMNFWFNKGSSFAIANVNHLIGFGDPKNPFAKIFQLPEALKERKDKKDRKRKTKSQEPQGEGMMDMSSIFTNNVGHTDSPLFLASELSSVDWFYCLSYVNKSVLELSFRILNHYLIGPKQASTCHIIVWLYFLIATGEAMEKYPESKFMFLWLFRKFFPWESFINYLNVLVSVASTNKNLNDLCCKYLSSNSNYIDYFNDHEFLPEVWKCWGSLWFDVISPKSDHNDVESAGISNYDLFDLPNSGSSPSNSGIHQNGQGRSKEKESQERDNDERLVRIILLARFLADKYEFGLVRSPEGFKFDQNIYVETESNTLISRAAPNLANELFSFVHEVMFADGKLLQNNFVLPISPKNLIHPDKLSMSTPRAIDHEWFNFDQTNSWAHDEGIQLGGDTIAEEDLAGYADSELDTENTGFGQPPSQQQKNNAAYKYERGQRQLGVHDAEPVNFDELYQENFVLHSQLMPNMTSSDMQIEGDLGDRMDTSLTYITLDTNIWLKHCGRVFKCVRSKVFRVSIPLIVFQELRSLRKSAEATIADAATRSVIIIRELYLAKEIVPLRFDGTIASDINETTEFENNSSWMSNVDSTLLNVVNEHDELSKKVLKGMNCTIQGPKTVTLDSKNAKLFRYCILITDDRNMRLRAKTSGLTSFQSKWLFGQLESMFSDKCID